MGWRAAVDVSASEAADACGLAKNMSRQMWFAVRHGMAARPEPSALSKFMMARGREDQPLAEREYADKILLRDDDDEKEWLLPEWGYRRAVQTSRPSAVYYLGATPDALVWHRGKIVRLIEYKTMQNGCVGVPLAAPRPADVIQCAQQMFCTGVQWCHLFYYRRSTGEFSCFNLRGDDDKFLKVVWPWLDQVLDRDEDTNLRMAPGERARREQLLLETFVCR